MDVTALGPAELAKSLPKHSRARLPVRIVLTSRYQHADPPQPFGLLRGRSERPHYRRPANETDEFPSPHGFTRAEDYVGDVKNITSHIEELCPEPNSGERPWMSALGQKQTSQPPMDVRFTPKSGHRSSMSGCPLL
jgi:hypothetical protein